MPELSKPHSPDFAEFSACMPLTHDGEWATTTAGHVVRDTDGTYRPRCYQPNRGFSYGQFMGTEDTYTFDYEYDSFGVEVERDWAIIDCGESDYKTSIMHLHGDEAVTISGVKSWDEISAMEGGSNTVYRRGRATGEENGNVTEVTPSNKWFEVSADADKGDSGGPFYTRENIYSSETAEILGIVSVTSTTGSNTAGNAMEYALSEMDSEFPY